jgi:hypothetical protein
MLPVHAQEDLSEHFDGIEGTIHNRIPSFDITKNAPPSDSARFPPTKFRTRSSVWTPASSAARITKSHGIRNNTPENFGGQKNLMAEPKPANFRK